MKNTEYENYQRIATCIEYLKTHYKQQPSLDDIAAVAGLSASHFQRLFKEWAGVSPKKFIQFLSVEHAKQLLNEYDDSLLNTAFETGLSGTGRLHDLFVKIEGMTPGEYKNGGQNLTIRYSFAKTQFGKLIVASTDIGLCHLFFIHDENTAEADLMARFPNAEYHLQTDQFQQSALSVFQQDWSKLDEIKLHIKGTDFQLKVWQTLLKLPLGNLATYGSIAKNINKPQASRAVGTAIGSNPIAFLIPCHRVIQKSGSLGGYMWGETRKSAIISWEASQLSQK